MAAQELKGCITLIAGADHTANQFKYVTVNSSGLVVLTGNGGLACGVLQNAPAASGRAAEVQPIAGGTIYKVLAGAAMATIGVEVMSDATGRAIAAATAGNRKLGILLTAAAAAGVMVEVLAVSPTEVP